MSASLPASSPGPATAAAPPSPLRRGYLRALAWSFALFNTLRVATYLPSMWAIHVSADSSQHSLWTWAGWLGANATTAAWLYEAHGRRADRVVWVHVANALMCGATCLLVLWYRI